MQVVAKSILHDDAAAEDAVQSAFCRILTVKRSEIKKIENPQAWLITVLRREALMRVRTDRRRQSREQRRAIADRPAAVSDYAQQWDIRQINDLIAALPDYLREIVVLKHVTGFTFNQIAQITQQNRNTVASRYRDAIEKLRMSLIQQQPPTACDLTRAKPPCPNAQDLTP